MAQPSVAREPSMEEILASIRRIIESNDPGNAKDMAGGLPSTYDDDDAAIGSLVGGADEHRGYEAVEFTPANDPGPGLVAHAPASPYHVEIQPEPRQPQPEAPKSMSLADLAARVRSASERADRYLVQEAPVQPLPRVESPVMTSRLAELRAPQVHQPELEPELVEEAVAQVEMPVSHEPQPSYAQPLVAPVAVEMHEIELEEVETTVAGPETAVGQSLTALVSAATVEQVSRSFDELAAAIDGQQRRSLDEMAEDMLRPMLRNWLDDNLPTLVERLVREEIERVARGPRR